MQYDYGTINPSKTSGGALALMLNNSRDASQSSHSGATRPAYAKAGMPWLDTSVVPWKYWMYDGADDILIGTFDTAANVFSPVVASSNISDASVVGKAVLVASSAASAQTAIGGSTIGKALFTAINDGAARTAISAANSGTNTDIRRLDNCGPETWSICIGGGALSSRTTGVANTAIGVGALTGVTTSNNNTAVGGLSLSGPHNSSGTNTAIGANAGFSSQDIGGNNTLIGGSAGYNSYSLNLCTFIGSSSGSELGGLTNCSTIGHLAKVTGSNQVQLGNSSTTTYVYGTVQNRSDLRDKTDEAPTKLGLSFINSLTPVDYKWDLREDYRKEGQKLSEIVKDGSKVRGRYHHGFIAQDIAKVIEETGIDFGGFQDHRVTGGDDVLSLGYDEFIAPMVKAIQELSAKVEILQEQLNKIKG